MLEPMNPFSTTKQLSLRLFLKFKKLSSNMRKLLIILALLCLIAGLCRLDNFGFGFDDVRIYNRALSASEVSQLYKLGTNFINSR